VLENGVAQKLDSVKLASRAPITGPSEPIERPEDEVRAAGEQGTRVVALYLDEFHVSPGASSDRVRDEATRFVNEQLRPGDLLAVLKPLDHLTSIRFTRDRDLARQIIAGFNGRKDDYTPRTPFEEQYMGRSPAAVRAARVQIVLSGLRALAVRMGDLDGGLSAVVLVTEGFSSDVPRSRDRHLPDLQSLLRTANRFDVVYYAFNPAQPQDAGAVTTDENGAPEDPSAMLRQFTAQTGGLASVAGQDLQSAFQRVSKDLDAYYVITYNSTTPTDGRFHELQVTSKRRDAQLRTRAGYWAPVPIEMRASSRVSLPAITPMRAVRRSPLIDSWLGMTIDASGQRRIIFTWTPAVTPQPRPGAKPFGRPDLLSVKVTTLTGAVLFEGDVNAARAPTVTGQRADSAVFAAMPGRLQFDYTILQADGTKLDVGSQDFDIPEVRPGNPVILPPQVFRAATAREFREISADANAAPLPGREFRRTETVILRIPTFDPSGASVQVSAKLMNRVGTILTDLTPITNENGVNLSQFDLPLARFAPGEYSIEVAAQSNSGVARELIRLKITG
jgi:VWFA-related protein